MNQEREKQILKQLLKTKRVYVKDLAASLYASEPSIRRDLLHLEKQGLLKRVHGGAILEDNMVSATKIPFVVRELEQSDAKIVMAKKALELISDGDVIFLDASSSAYALVPYLATKSGLTVITGGLKSASRLCEYGIRTVCIGGLLIPEAGSMIGSDAFSILDRYNADICFFSCRGLSYDGLLTDISPDEDHVRQHMIRRAKRSYLLCAGEKIGRLYYHNLAHVSEITGVISESPLPDFSAVNSGDA